MIAAIMELDDNPTVKTLLNAAGFVVILCVLLYLPTVGYGVPGLKGTALGLIAWAAWWWLVRTIYRKTGTKQASVSPDHPSSTFNE